MSGKEQPPIMDQKLCVAGCGFFGSSNTSNMCSKCWASKSILAADSQGKKDSSSVASSSLPPMTLSKPSAIDESDSTAPAPAPPASVAQGGAAPSDPATGAAAPATPPAVATPATAAAAAAAATADVATASVLPPQPPAPISAPAATATPVAASASSSPSSLSVAPSPSPLSFSVGGATPPAIGGGAEAEGAAVATAAAMAAEAEAPVRPEQKNRKRCFTCSKKVGYTGIACRCNYVFCSLHRYPEQHDCTFDFKTSDRNDLKRTVVGGGQFSKVDRL